MTQPAQPVVSVVIPCFNQGQYVREAIASVEKHPHPSLCEIIIVNDGSTGPETVDTLRALAEEGYHVINQQNKGVAAARNRGIREARGEYILSLDSDNMIRPAYITKAIEVFESRPEVGIVYGNSQYFGDLCLVNRPPEFDIRTQLAIHNIVDACAVFRKQVWVEVGGYDEDMRIGYEDWDFVLCIAERGWSIFHVDEVLYDYRYRNDSMWAAARKPENHRLLLDYMSRKHAVTLRTEFTTMYSELKALAEQNERMSGIAASLDMRLGRVCLLPFRSAWNLLRRFIRPEYPPSG